MIEISNLVTRGEFKSEIIKELERQHTSINRHANLPGVDHERLSTLQQRQTALLTSLHENQESLGQHLKSDQLLNSVRQRQTAPGGTCDFDLPLYAFWMNLPDQQRAETMEAWLSPFETAAKSIALCLETIRNSADPVTIQAKKGYYEQALDNSAEIQLIRILLDNTLPLFPTISAGKQRFNIRLMEWLPKEQRTPQTAGDIELKLLICGI
jgi:cell division protein ZapD